MRLTFPRERPFLAARLPSFDAPPRHLLHLAILGLTFFGVTLTWLPQISQSSTLHPPRSRSLFALPRGNFLLKPPEPATVRIADIEAAALAAQRAAAQARSAISAMSIQHRPTTAPASLRQAQDTARVAAQAKAQDATVKTAEAPAPQPQAQASPRSSEANAPAFVQTALNLRGTPYRWGGNTPAGFDCSGFIRYVLGQHGIEVTRDIGGQLRAGIRIERGALQPGDLVFFVNTFEAGLSHAGIYVGNGEFVSAVSEGKGVRLESLNDPFWSAHYYSATRLPSPGPPEADQLATIQTESPQS